MVSEFDKESVNETELFSESNSSDSGNVDDIVTVLRDVSDFNDVKGYDPARTIITISYEDNELIESLNILGFFYILVGNDDTAINDLKNNILKNIDGLYNIEVSNYKYKSVLKQEGLLTAVEQFDSLLTAISKMDKNEFVRVARYSIKNLNCTADKMKQLIKLTEDNNTYETQFNKVKNDNLELRQKISYLELKADKLSKATEALTKIPELQDKIKESDDTIQNLYTEIANLKALNGSKVSDANEIINLKEKIAHLEAYNEELQIKNSEYEKELNKSLNVTDTNKDLIIQELREQIKLLKSNSNSETNINDYLPILTPDKLVLNNVSRLIYLKEIGDFAYIDCVLEYLSFICRKRTDYLVIVLDRESNEFHNKLYDSLGYLNDDSLIHVVTDLNLTTLKHIGIQSAKYIVVIDRLCVDKLAVIDYIGLDTLFLVNTPDEISDYKLDVGKCVVSYSTGDNVAYSVDISTETRQEARMKRMTTMRKNQFFKYLYSK